MLRCAPCRGAADLVHFQWLAVPQLDGPLLPRGRPLVLTAHDSARRGPPRRRAAPARALRRADRALGGRRAAARRRSSASTADARPRDPARRLRASRGARRRRRSRASSPSRRGGAGRPLLRADAPLQGPRRAARRLGARSPARSCGSSGARASTSRRCARAPRASVRWVPRYVTDGELAACFRRADVVVAALPRDRAVGRARDGAGVRRRRSLLSDVGGFGEVAAAARRGSCRPATPRALAAALGALLADAGERERLCARRARSPRGSWSWRASPSARARSTRRCVS